jgi:outer membrane protein
MKKVLSMILTAAVSAGSAVAVAYESGDWILRAGATAVSPNSSSGDIVLPTGLIAEADVDDNTQLGLIPAYMLSNKWGVEVLLATPFSHDIEARGKGAINGTNLAAGSTKHLPPTVSIQWYPRGGMPGWQPYVGVGLNYTYFFDEDVDSELVGLLGDLTAGAVNSADLELDDSFGLAAQGGVDIPLSENWAINLAVWYIDISTEATISAKVDGVTAAKVKFDVDIDPWVYNIGIAYKF